MGIDGFPLGDLTRFLVIKSIGGRCGGHCLQPVGCRALARFGAARPQVVVGEVASSLREDSKLGRGLYPPHRKCEGKR